MIQVTLTFPDQAALVAFFAGQQTVVHAAPVASAPVPTVAENKAKSAELKKLEAKNTKPVQEPAAEPSEPAATAASTASSSEPAASATDKVDYAVLQKAVFTLAGKSREAAAAVVASFGVKTFKDLSEDKWAEALAAVQAKTAEL